VGVIVPHMKSPDDESISSIAPYVMKYLSGSGYFEKLDNLLCPENSSTPCQHCDGTYKLSKSILLASDSELDRHALDDIFAVLKSKGGCCDCEVLYNVPEKSRLRARYWRSRAAGEPPRAPHAGLK
jgi:hypothetical protein